MGCYCLSNPKLNEALILPDQEVVFTRTENLHPFSHEYSITLFLEFNIYKNQVQITKQEFQDTLKKLGIEVSQFYNPSSPLYVFTQTLFKQNKGLNLHKLKLASVLLGIGSFQDKMNCLLHIYGQQGYIKKQNLRTMLNDLIKFSIRTLPKLSRTSLNEFNYNFYISRLNCMSPYFIHSFISKLNFQKDYIMNFQLFERFYQHPFFYSVVSSHGIRMLLLQQDYKTIKLSKKLNEDQQLKNYSLNNTSDQVRSQSQQIFLDRTQNQRLYSVYQGRQSQQCTSPIIKTRNFQFQQQSKQTKIMVTFGPNHTQELIIPPNSNPIQLSRDFASLHHLSPAQSLKLIHNVRTYFCSCSNQNSQQNGELRLGRSATG